MYVTDREAKSSIDSDAILMSLKELSIESAIVSFMDVQKYIANNLLLDARNAVLSGTVLTVIPLSLFITLKILGDG